MKINNYNKHKYTYYRTFKLDFKITLSSKMSSDNLLHFIIININYAIIHLELE